MEICTRNVNTAFSTLVRGFHDGTIQTVATETRAGAVRYVQEPVLVAYEKPKERVLFNMARDANPFFHLYEALYMLAGRNDVAPLDYYLSGKWSQYSDDKVTANGAYGYRWRHARRHKIDDGYQRTRDREPYTIDQLAILIDHIKRKPENRRFVLQMWNTEDDLLKIDTSRDVCCNLSVVFSVRDEWLDMTVFNRSNDLIYGMLGANAVHFSILQEYMATNVDREVGVYYQITNNLHVYEWNWKPEEWLRADAGKGVYSDYCNWDLVPLVKDPATFDEECARFVDQGWGENSISPNWNEPFIQNVAFPMRLAFHNHKRRNYEKASDCVERIEADDWRIAARNWIEKRKANWESKSAADRRSTLQDAD